MKQLEPISQEAIMTYMQESELNQQMSTNFVRTYQFSRNFIPLIIVIISYRLMDSEILLNLKEELVLNMIALNALPLLFYRK